MLAASSHTHHVLAQTRAYPHASPAPARLPQRQLSAPTWALASAQHREGLPVSSGSTCAMRIGPCGCCAMGAVGLRPPCRHVRAAAKASRAGSVPADPVGFEGFGDDLRAPLRREFEDDGVGGSGGGLAEDDEEEEIQLRPEYRLYADPLYKPMRTVGPVDIDTINDEVGRGMISTTDVLPGDLLVISPALGFLEGSYMVAPDAEDLCAEMIKAKLSPAQKNVLALLYDGTAETMHKSASMATLDLRFWGKKGGKKGTEVNPSADAEPSIDKSKLLEIIKNCACSDLQQDPAAMQARQEKGSGFIGIWPEFAMINHSCLPNSSITVIKDRLLIHATDEVPKGEQVTRNYLGPMVTAPQPVRQQALKELGYGFTCNCPRCTLEQRVSQEMQEALQDAYSWYMNEALPAWNQAHLEEDLNALKNILQEAHIMIGEVEEKIQAEPDLSEDEQLLLRASMYDCYDVLVMCDEVVNAEKAERVHLEACLQLIRVFAPGSENHTMVAAKYETAVRTQALAAEEAAAKAVLRAGTLRNKGSRRTGPSVSVQKAQALEKQAKVLLEHAEDAFELFLDAYLSRYGFLNSDMFQKLREGMELHTDMMEQIGYMEASGQTERTTNINVDGVNFSIIDSMKQDESMGAGAEEGKQLKGDGGVQFAFMDEPAGQEEAEEAEEATDGEELRFEYDDDMTMRTMEESSGESEPEMYVDEVDEDYGEEGEVFDVEEYEVYDLSDKKKK